MILDQGAAYDILLVILQDFVAQGYLDIGLQTSLGTSKGLIHILQAGRFFSSTTGQKSLPDAVFLFFFGLRLPSSIRP